jgi:hypothetical protein
MNAQAQNQPPQFTITSVAGNGVDGYSGDGGPAINASLGYPQGVAVDSKGNVYTAEVLTGRVRKMAPDGTITSVAGIGTQGLPDNGSDSATARCASRKEPACNSAQ